MLGGKLALTLEVNLGRMLGGRLAGGWIGTHFGSEFGGGIFRGGLDLLGVELAGGADWHSLWK